MARIARHATHAGPGPRARQGAAGRAVRTSGTEGLSGLLQSSTSVTLTSAFGMSMSISSTGGGASRWLRRGAPAMSLATALMSASLRILSSPTSLPSAIAKEISYSDVGIEASSERMLSSALCSPSVVRWPCTSRTNFSMRARSSRRFSMSGSTKECHSCRREGRGHTGDRRRRRRRQQQQQQQRQRRQQQRVPTRARQRT